MSGQQAFSDTSDVEDNLMGCLIGLWGGEKWVTRTLTFRHVVEIDPAFLDGVHSANHFIRLNKWLYYGFTIRQNLSILKLASVGQKLTLDWKQKLKELRSIVASKQRVTARPDGSNKVEGVKDKYWFNTYHVPIWYKYVDNYTWGLRDSGRWNVKTGVKDKDRFTAQLVIATSGKKLITFLLFKGENTAYSSIFALF